MVEICQWRLETNSKKTILIFFTILVVWTLTAIWYVETVKNIKKICCWDSNYIRSCVDLPLLGEWDIATNRRMCVVPSCKLTLLFHYAQVGLCVPSECQVVICLPWPVLHPDHMAPDHVLCFRSMIKMIWSLSWSDLLHVLSGSISRSRKSFVCSVFYLHWGVISEHPRYQWTKLI